VVRNFRDEQGGQTVVLVALLFIVLLGFVALALDVGRFYAERRFIQDAVDSASLACAAKYATTGVAQDGWNAGNDILQQRNLLRNPLGISVSYPAVWTDALEYDGAAIDWNLSGGIKPINGSQGLGCRVAITVDVPTIFIRVVNPTLPTIRVITRSYAKAKGGMLPVVINRYKDPPGPSSTFLDYTKQETYQLNNPGVCGADDVGGCPNGAYSPPTCTGAGCLWGPETVIVGNGYSASDSDFRGFIALDVRDFSTVDASNNPLHEYYNNTEGLNTNLLKDQEASYILAGGYPGPDLIPYIPGSSPVQTGLQIAAMSGNSAGVVVDDFNQFFRIGDLILTQVFDGQVRTIPDFTLGQLSQISAVSPSGPVDGPTFRVGANQTFRAANSTVTLVMLRDEFNAGSGNDTPTAIHTFDFDPSGAFTPAGGAGTLTTIKNLHIDGSLASGIYSVVISGTGHETGGTELATHRMFVPVKIGTVTRDFTLTFNTTGVEVITPANAVFTGQLSTGSGGAGWGSGAVSLAFDRGPTCAAGQAYAYQSASEWQCISGVTMTSSPSGFVPNKTSPPIITISVPTGSLDGTYELILRARGTNSDLQPVVHVIPMQIYANTTATGSNKNYVNIQGYVVFEVTTKTSNTIYGRAVSRVAADPNDPDLATAKRIRLVPWEEP